MSILLFGVGAVAFAAGAAMVGFGIPINEFSFGNTLIVAGTTAAAGGLIVIGLGAVVAHLQRIADALAVRQPVRPSRPLNTFESAVGGRPPAAPARIPFPPKQTTEPRPETALREPFPPELRPDFLAPTGSPFKDHESEFVAPTLPNPDQPPVAVEDEVSLSPRHPMAPSSPSATEFNEPDRSVPQAPFRLGRNADMDKERGAQPMLGAGWRSPPPATPAPTRQPHTTYFDAMWPAEAKAELKPEPKPSEPRPGDLRAAEVKPAAPSSVEPKWTSSPPAGEDVLPKPAAIEQHSNETVELPEDEPRAVAILKSGVVDGMGYTLYVDGSIEAELPQGTLRFASINELRSHLEKTA